MCIDEFSIELVCSKYLEIFRFNSIGSIGKFFKFLAHGSVTDMLLALTTVYLLFGRVEICSQYSMHEGSVCDNDTIFIHYKDV